MPTDNKKRRLVSIRAADAEDALDRTLEEAHRQRRKLRWRISGTTILGGGVSVVVGLGVGAGQDEFDARRYLAGCCLVSGTFLLMLALMPTDKRAVLREFRLLLSYCPPYSNHLHRAFVCAGTSRFILATMWLICLNFLNRARQEHEEFRSGECEENGFATWYCRSTPFMWLMASITMAVASFFQYKSQRLHPRAMLDHIWLHCGRTYAVFGGLYVAFMPFLVLGGFW